MRKMLRGRAGELAVAKLELEARHTHTHGICIDHELVTQLEQLANEAAHAAGQSQAQARGRAQLGSIRPPLLLQLPPQPQLRCRGRHNFLRCAGKEDPSIMEVGPARKNNSNSGRQFYAPPSARLLLPQGCTSAAGVQGPGRRAGCGRARARSHTHTENICIHHELEQLAIANEAKQLQAQARGRAQLGSI
jgi:hypothetical protein